MRRLVCMLGSIVSILIFQVMVSSASQIDNNINSSSTYEYSASVSSKANITKTTGANSDMASNNKQEKDVKANKSSKQLGSEKWIPDGQPFSVLGIVIKRGFNVQPQPEVNITTGGLGELSCDAEFSVLDRVLSGRLLGGIQYQWYKSTDGVNFDAVGGATSQSYVIKDNERTERDVYYAVKATLKGLLPIISPSFYIHSNITHIHYSTSEVIPSDFTMSIDKNYLYNELATSDNSDVTPDPDTAVAKGKVTPANATGTVTYSSSDTSLATVDKKTGVVTANTKGKSGQVIIRGTFTTSRTGTIISDGVIVRVGGGLDDQVVNEGQTATFTILGKTTLDVSGISRTVEWHKVSSAGVDSVIPGDGDSCEVKKAAKSQNGEHYYAIITYSGNIAGKQTTIKMTTNKALLTVKSISKPELKVTNSVSYAKGTGNNNKDTPQHLFDVKTGSQLDYRGVVKLTNSEKDGNVVYTSYLDKNEVLIGLDIDGKEIPLRNDVKVGTTEFYKVYQEGGDQKITVYNMKCTDNVPRTIDIYTRTTEEEHDPFIFTPFASLQFDEEHASSTYKGQQIEIDFDNTPSGEITLSPKAIDYGIHTGVLGTDLYTRTSDTNSPNAVLDVEDNRSEKSPVKMYVQQDSQFKDADTNTTLSAILRMYKSDGTFSNMDVGTQYMIAEYGEGKKATNVCWKKKEGLLFFANGSNAPKGTYHTQLTWTAVEGF